MTPQTTPALEGAEQEFIGRRLLVVEDEPDNRALVEHMLRALGCFVAAAESGAKALTLLEGGRFDLILMDCHMPGMSGYELTAEIRHREGPKRRTPIIALTASGGVGERAKCLAAGMDDYISKPVRPRELAALLRMWLARGEVGSQMEGDGAHSKRLANPPPAS